MPLVEYQENFEAQEENEDQAIVQDEQTRAQSEERVLDGLDGEEKEEFGRKNSCLDIQSTEMDHTEHTTKNHFTLKIRKKKDVNKAGIFQCSECPVEFTLMKNLNKHKRKKHEGRMFYCDQCEFKAGENYYIKRHVLSKHMGVRFECDQCDKSFVFEQALKLHVRSVHEGFGYACEYCDYSCAQRQNLYNHISKRHREQHQINKQKVNDI